MKKSKRRLVIVYTGLIIFYAFLLLPIVWLVLSSFRNTDSIQVRPARPVSIRTNGDELRRGLPDSQFDDVSHQFVHHRHHRDALVVFIASLGAYALSRFQLRAKNLFMMLALMPQFFPYVLILIPFYVLMSNIGLVDSHLGLILTHTSITLPFALWMLTGYFNAIPRDLDQAALIDGCSRLGVLFRIIYPIAIPGMVVAGFFAFVVSWGDYLFVSILSQSPETQTLPIGLQTFMSSLQVRWGLITAGTVIAIVPTILFFAIVQRRLVAGLTAGAVK